jgi:hypothetical protein
VTARRPYRRCATPRHFAPGEGRVLRFYGRWIDDTGFAKEVRTLEVRWVVQLSETSFFGGVYFFTHPFSLEENSFFVEFLCRMITFIYQKYNTWNNA